jgi:hypothetical protein
MIVGLAPGDGRNVDSNFKDIGTAQKMISSTVFLSGRIKSLML